MKATVESLHERYSSMTTEALADLYHEGELTYLAVSVLHEVITSRGLDWAKFTKLPTTEPEFEPRSDWELWKQASGQGITDETRDESQLEATGQDESPATSTTVGASSDAELQVAKFYAQLKRLTPHAFVTPALVLINVGVFVAMIAAGVDLMSPSIEHLLSWGANFAPITTGGEWWRLLTSNYVHIGIIHIAVNMWVLWDAGRLVERLLGNIGFMIMYVLSGVFGSFTSILWNPTVVSAGASGAVFGVYGCLIGFLLLSRGSIPNKVLRGISSSALVFVAYNIFFAIGEEGIDMAAHVGGLTSGFLCGVMMRLPLAWGSAGRRWVGNWIVGGIGAAVITLAIGSGLSDVVDVRAAQLLRDSAETGNADRQFNLGAAYDVVQDYEKAARWYRAAAEHGYAEAQFRFGTMYEAGEGVSQDYAEAVRWYRAAAEQSHAKGQLNLGFMYETGRGVAQDFATAFKWYLIAAGQGDAVAQHNLGVMYHEGRGVAQDDEEAIRWTRMAAEQGYADAQSNLGIVYHYGQGVAQDDEEAIRWYHMAAEQRVATAQYNLGVMYYEGRGVAQDDEEAIRWTRMAAEQGYPEAQYNLGWMYANGRGVPQDYEEAYAWIATAAGQWFPGTEAILQALREQMTSSELESALQLAREYREKYVPQ